MRVGLRTVLCRVKESYWGKLDSYWYVFLPLGSDGLVVVDETTKLVYDLIDGKRNVGEVFKLIKLEDKKAEIKDLQKLILSLIDKGLASLEQGGKKMIVNQKPKVFEVWMHITNQCNLRCKYCYVKKSDEFMSREKMREIGKRVINTAKKQGFLKVKFKLSGGESLLRLNEIIAFVIEMRKLGEKKGLKVDFVVMTNGILLTRKVARKLKKMKIRVAVSLDGLGKYHDVQRQFADGRGSFLLVIKGIENLIKGKVSFNVSVTITKNNIENLPALTDFFLRKKIPFAFNFYRDIGVGKKLEANNKDLIKYLKKAYKRVELNIPKYRVCNGLLDGVVIGKPHKYVCGMGRSYLAIGINGRLFGCQMMMGMRDSHEGYEPSCRSDFMKAMRKNDFTDGRGVEGKKECLGCKWRYVCCGGCPLLSRERKGDWRERSPYCEVYKEMLPELLKLEARRLIKYGCLSFAINSI
ncbi:MAG: radical SAM protein [Candidatus Beckwithbacteria bacterium]